MVTVSAPVFALAMPVVAQCINTEVEAWEDGHQDNRGLNHGSDLCYAKLCTACYVLLDECAYC